MPTMSRTNSKTPDHRKAEREALLATLGGRESRRARQLRGLVGLSAVLAAGRRFSLWNQMLIAAQCPHGISDLFLEPICPKIFPAGCHSQWAELQCAWPADISTPTTMASSITRYLQSVPGTTLEHGQRLSVTERDARRTIDNTRALVDVITRP
jgi:hypothetical protein